MAAAFKVVNLMGFTSPLQLFTRDYSRQDELTRFANCLSVQYPPLTLVPKQAISDH